MPKSGPSSAGNSASLILQGAKRTLLNCFFPYGARANTNWVPVNFLHAQMKKISYPLGQLILHPATLWYTLTLQLFLHHFLNY